MSVLHAAPLMDWPEISHSGVRCPPGHRFIALYQDHRSLPRPLGRDHIAIWFNVLHLWSAGYDVILLSSGVATCTGNSGGILPTSQFVTVSWLDTTLWAQGIDRTEQVMATDHRLRRILRPRLDSPRLRSRSPHRAVLLNHLHHYLKPHRYGPDEANPALTVPSIGLFLEQRADLRLDLDNLHHLLSQRSVQQHFCLVGTDQHSRLVPRRSRRTLPAPIMSARATRTAV